jgi:hypothetical protein
VAERTESGWDLYVLLSQGPPAYPLEVPVAVRTERGQETLRVPLSSVRDAATLRINAKPLAVAVDPEFQLWRQLDAAEAPPILREAIAARDPVIVNLEGNPEFARAAETLGRTMLEQAPRMVVALPPATPVAMLVGTPARIDAALAKHRLGPRPRETKGHGTAQVWTVRNGTQTVGVISAQDADALAALARALPHLGGQSWAVFEGPRPVARGVWRAEAVSVPVRLSRGN